MGDAFNICSLFSGGAGLDLGIHRAVRNARTVVFVEREAYACEVLAARMEEGSLAPAPVWTDVTTFDGRPWRGIVDCVAGGSPCQDLSVAGKRAGLDGERSGLFWHFVRIVEEIRPGFVFWENVGGAASSLPRVFGAFEALGYSGAAVKLRASDVGASHQRARIFLLGKLADSECAELRLESGRSGRENRRGAAESPGTGRNVADAASLGRREGRTESDPQWRASIDDAGAGETLANGNGNGCGGERRGRLLDGIGAAQRNDLDGRGGPLELADSGDARREGRERAGAPCENEGSSQPTAERGRPEWPPGPGGDWSGIDPRFFPAQPRIRGVAHELARGVVATVSEVESVWADRLRLLGNGVHPATAAAAWLFLEGRVSR